MVLIPIGNGYFSCLSGDTKPTAGIASGSHLTEYGIQTVDYYFNGSVWESTPEAIAGHLTWGGSASGVIFSGLQRLPQSLAASYVIWNSGGTYQALNTTRGLIEFSGTSAAAVFGSVASTLASTSGGVVHLRPAKYTFTSGFSVISSGRLDTTAVTFQGEGPNTILSFEPAAFASHGIFLEGGYHELKNLMITANSGVQNLVFINAQATINPPNPNNEHPGGRGLIERVTFRSFGWSDSLQWVSGQRGIFLEGNVSGGSLFYWRLFNNDFQSMHVGIQADTPGAPFRRGTTTFQVGNNFSYCDIGVYLNSNQHVVSNMFCQDGGEFARFGVRLGGNALVNKVNNVTVEIFGRSGAAVILDSGCKWNMIYGCENSASKEATGSGAYSIIDNSTELSNSIVYLNYDTPNDVYKTQMRNIDFRRDDSSNTVFLERDTTTQNAGAGVVFRARNTSGVPVDYAAVQGLVLDATTGLEDGVVRFLTYFNGASETNYIFRGHGEIVPRVSGRINAQSGFQIGTASGNMIGFYGVTPVAKQSGAVAYTMDATYTSGVQSSIQKMYNALRNYGLLT